jgi:hypothetical protein
MLRSAGVKSWEVKKPHGSIKTQWNGKWKPSTVHKKNSPKKPHDPTINPYTWQKINPDKAKNRAQRAEKKKKRNAWKLV